MAQSSTKSAALYVLGRLRQAGFEAFLAGGCVRDMLLGMRSSDYDITTSATPQQVKGLFRHVLQVGAKFGVAMVMHRRVKVEVTTFRSDLSYSNGRRPDGVRFATPREDALRRDFTINGMFYDPIARRVIDYVGGRKDLARGIVRTIGSPMERFAEDYLRMLRAVRFAVRLGFSIAPATGAAIRQHASRITSISGERVFDELSKMLCRGSAAQALRTMHRVGLSRPVLGELFAGTPLVCPAAGPLTAGASGGGADARQARAAGWAAAVRRVEAVAHRRDFLLTLAALLVGLPPETITRIVRRWGASNEIRDALCWMSRHLGEWRLAADMPLCDFKRLLANGNFQRLRVLWRIQERFRAGRQVESRRISRRLAGIPRDQIAPPPLVTGADLKAMGLPEGPHLGRIVHALYDAQLNEEFSTRQAALKAAREMVDRG